MVLGALDDAGGQQYLAAQAQANPAAFMTLLGKVLPLQLTGGGGGTIQHQGIDAPAKETREQWLARQGAAPAAAAVQFPCAQSGTAVGITVIAAAESSAP